VAESGERRDSWSNISRLSAPACFGTTQIKCDQVSEVVKLFLTARFRPPIHNASGQDQGGHILLPLPRAPKQPREVAPGKLRSVFLRQVLLDYDPDVGERRKLHDVGNDDRTRQ
jgi:hypothetical protein